MCVYTVDNTQSAIPDCQDCNPIPLTRVELVLTEWALLLSRYIQECTIKEYRNALITIPSVSWLWDNRSKTAATNDIIFINLNS